MSRLRRSLGVLVSAGAALSAVLLAPASASAAGNITVEWARQTADPYVLQVTVNDSNGLQLTGMTVHLLLAGATDVYDITDMAYTSGPPSAQIWTAAAPIPQAALPLGTYAVNVDATDNDETDAGIPAQTPMPIWIGYTTTLTASATPATLSYGETPYGTTISGMLTGVVARSPYTTPVPLGGVAVGIEDNATQVTTPIGTTQSDGSYSGHVELPVPGDSYQVVVAKGPTWTLGYIPAPVTWAVDPTRIVSVKVTPEDFNYGGTVPATITGTVQYLNPGTGWQPLPDQPVRAWLAHSTIHTVVTDSSGHFTWQYLPSNDTPWSVEAGNGSDLGYASASGSVHVAVPLRVTSFTASLSTLGELTVTSCVRATVAGFSGPASPLAIQYSAQPSGPWLTLGHVARHSNSACSLSGESYFSGTLPVQLARAYYRAYAKPTPDNQSAFGKPVLLWKYVTRIIALHVSPGSVHRGGKLTVSGRLQTYNGGWRNFARQQILIILKPKGSKVWYWMVKVNTNASGYFTSTFTDPVSASWSADYDGNATHFASGAAVYYVPIS